MKDPLANSWKQNYFLLKPGHHVLATLPYFSYYHEKDQMKLQPKYFFQGRSKKVKLRLVV